MIDKIEVVNFQGHANSVLELSPRVNVIVGPSDSGKSALVRALYWLFMNRPTGTSNIREGETKCSVTATFRFPDDTKRIVERLRTSSENIYIIDGSVYKLVGSSVPEEVRVLTHVDEVNFSTQFSQPVMVMDSPGDVARSISTVMKFDVVDEAMRMAGKKGSDLKASIKVSEEDIKKSKEKLKVYDGIETVAQELEHVSALSDLYDRLDVEERDIQKAVEAVELTERVMVMLSSRLDGLDELVKGVQEAVQEFDNSIGEIDTIVSTVSDLVSLNHVVNKLTSRIVPTETVDSLRTMIEEYESEKSSASDLSTALGLVSTGNGKIEYLTTLMESLAKSKSDTVALYEKTFVEEGRCPLCMTPVGSIDMHALHGAIS